MKLILGIEYDGSSYFGWQRQLNVPSIQEFLEQAVSQVANEEIKVFCASRTDSGVHAIGQVVHFNTNVFRSNYSWVSGINRNLPVDIVVQWIVIESVDTGFHARFSAIARQYRYIIYNCDTRPALLNKRVAYCKKFLDIKKMKYASQCLLGEHDFTSFRSLKCQSSSPYRNLHFLRIDRYKDYVIIDIQANAFLHHMVRNIVGSLLDVGWGNYSENWIFELLSRKNRSLGGITAPSNGLYLLKVLYPLCYSIPTMESCNFFFC